MIQWDVPNDNQYKISRDSTQLKYKSNKWGTFAHSRQQLSSTNIVYLQMRIVQHYKSKVIKRAGIKFGISNKKNGRFNRAVYMLNSDDRFGAKNTYFVATTGDIIGVVVDNLNDRVLFYLNGKFMALGKEKPSTVRPMYAMVNMYHYGCKIEIGEFIKYHKLERYYPVHK